MNEKALADRQECQSYSTHAPIRERGTLLSPERLTLQNHADIFRPSAWLGEFMTSCVMF